MSRMEIDNRGLACPLPVIKTKKALQALQTLQGLATEIDSENGVNLVSIVDNEAALENVTRMLEKEGYLTHVQRRGEDTYIHIVEKGKTEANEKIEANENSISRRIDDSGAADGVGSVEGTTVVITSSTLGQGKEELGIILMRSFIISIKEMKFLPARIIFLNSGVLLTAKKSLVLDDLRELEEGGVQIFSCGTCVDYYQLKDEMAIGRITNIYDIVEYLQHSNKQLIL